MPDDNGFERDVVNELNDHSDGDYFAKRFKQHRFSSQICDVVVLSSKEEYYSAIECKSKQVDVEKLNKDNNETEGKLYFSQHFSETDEGHQVENFKEFLDKSHMKGLLAIAYRRGRGRKVHYYAIDFDLVYERYQEGETGVPKSFVEEHGIELFDKKENGKKKDDKFRKIFDLW